MRDEPRIPVKRDSERLVVGSHGDIYYTPNHYKDFVLLRGISVEQVDEVWGFIPVIYIKESHILRERVGSLVQAGWKIVNFISSNISDSDSLEAEVIRATDCPWPLPDEAVWWTLDFVEEIDQWKDLSQGLFVYVSDFDGLIRSSPAEADTLYQHIARMQDRYRWERLRDGDEDLKFIYGFECSEKNLPLVRDFFRGYVVVVDRFDPEQPELESAEALGPFADEYPHLSE